MYVCMYSQAFEKTLLPAFQAGTKELFSQIQTAFETGKTYATACTQYIHQMIIYNSHRHIHLCTIQAWLE